MSRMFATEKWKILQVAAGFSLSKDKFIIFSYVGGLVLKSHHCLNEKLDSYMEKNHSQRRPSLTLNTRLSYMHVKFFTFHSHTYMINREKKKIYVSELSSIPEAIPL